jgi:lysophospholipase L1-like esterase
MIVRRPDELQEVEILGRASQRRRLLRLILMTGTLTLLVILLVLMFFWIGVLITPSVRQRAIIALLVGLEVVYALAVMSIMLGLPISGVSIYWTMRKGSRSALAARGLLLCAASLFAISAAEVAVTLQRSWTAGPVGSAKADPVLPELFPEPAEDSALTLAVLGESSAYGVPFYDWHSVGRIVAWKLGEAIPGKQFREELLAVPGWTLEGQHAKLARLSRRPAAIIVYCGHNEFAARIPWSRTVDHYLDEQTSILFEADRLAARVSPVCSLLSEMADRFRVGLTPPGNLHPPLVDTPAYTPVEYAARLADFRHRLAAIAIYSQRVGAIPILVVPPSNDAGFEPNRSFLAADSTRAEREAYARTFIEARSMEDTSPERAIEIYRSLAASQPGFAETHYRLGCLLEKAGQWELAYAHFVRARDLDGWPMRALTSFQDAYREVAAEHDCVLVDGQAIFHAVGPHGLLDDHLFADGMHPSLKGQIALAQGILDALHERRALGWPTGGESPRIDIAACANHFGFLRKDWKSIAVRIDLFYRGTAGLRYDPTARQAKMNAYYAATERLEAGEAPESIGLPNLGFLPDSAGGEETDGRTGSASGRASSGAVRE